MLEGVGSILLSSSSFFGGVLGIGFGSVYDTLLVSHLNVCPSVFEILFLSIAFSVLKISVLKISILNFQYSIFSFIKCTLTFLLFKMSSFNL